MSDPTKRTLADWQAGLDASDEEIDAGLTVPLAPVLDRLRKSIRQLGTTDDRSRMPPD